MSDAPVLSNRACTVCDPLASHQLRCALLASGAPVGEHDERHVMNWAHVIQCEYDILQMVLAGRMALRVWNEEVQLCSKKESL